MGKKFDHSQIYRRQKQLILKVSFIRIKVKFNHNYERENSFYLIDFVKHMHWRLETNLKP